MKQFKDLFSTYTWAETKASILSKTTLDVERALSHKKRGLEDFKALISPAALPYLEQMAQQSHALTQKRFGKTIQLFAPMYLSNECNNICTYCGFSMEHGIKRKTLSSAEILQEVNAIKALGFNHVLLVTGEANHTVHVDYFLNALKIIKPNFSHVSIEVQPLDQHEYEALQQAGVHSVLVYQETYHKDKYKDHHPKGKKSNFDYRLGTPDRIGRAGMYKIGLGVLLGLEDWRTDSFFCALHLDYLQKTYWQTKYSVAFPRIRPAEGVQADQYAIEDKELIQLLCAYRLWNEDLEISISTREREEYRNHLIKLGATTMSAGSKTNPGGYCVDVESLEQFEISDERSPAEFSAVIAEQGYTPVWKDWDKIF
ncbi:2-iminoacetate synthase ThiH [Pedobacter sp. AW1-32]|uniref:2-iminoacetate synthase ThiH n=1 Tax=Pedobacter sp. AW1-32 TaxID=3383026 RepID=UPI003FED9FA7